VESRSARVIAALLIALGAGMSLLPDPSNSVAAYQQATACTAASIPSDWRRTVTSGDHPIVGLFRAESETELDSIIGALPLYEWLEVGVTSLESHANDPADATVPRRHEPRARTSLPYPRLTKV
jgi:muconolactone delta-isomerase